MSSSGSGSSRRRHDAPPGRTTDGDAGRQGDIGDDPPKDFRLARGASWTRCSDAGRPPQKVLRDSIDLSKPASSTNQSPSSNESDRTAPGSPTATTTSARRHRRRRTPRGAGPGYRKAVELKADRWPRRWSSTTPITSRTRPTCLEATADAACGGGGAGAAAAPADSTPVGCPTRASSYGTPRSGAGDAASPSFSEAKEEADAATKVIRSKPRPAYRLTKATSTRAVSPAPSRRPREIFKATPTGEHADEVKKDIEQLKPLVKQ